MADGIKIYRGVNQIGGVVTEIRKGDHRILIDFGANLPGTENAEKNDDRLVKEVFSEDDVTTDAVLFTHYHGDHVGLKNRIPEGIPMYAGETAIRIMKEIADRVDKMREYTGSSEERDLPVIDRIKSYWGLGKRKDFSGIGVTPLVCDHSALDAYMFVIEMNGKRILYTGDFRAHGIPGKNTFRRLITKKVGKIDLLITEGTMVSRIGEEKNNPVRTEENLRKEAKKIFAEHKENVVLVSSTNIDSVMSFYQAVPEGKAFLCDPYQAELIKIAIEARQLWFPRRYFYGRVIYVLCPNEDLFYMLDLAKYETTGVLKNPFRMARSDKYQEKGFVMLARPNRNPKLQPGKFEEYMRAMKEPYITYSMWKGYLKGGKAEDPAIVRFMEGHEDHMKVLHTSGHAYVEDLKELMDMTDPGEIIPMHTESTDLFKKSEVFRDYESRIRKLKPGELYPL